MARRVKVNLKACDGYLIAATWFKPEALEPQGAVVVVPGGGVSAEVYARLADALADRGLAVLTFDCRGIGGSRHGSLRGLDAGVEHWGSFDTEAALSAAEQAYPGNPPFVVAHSVGCLYWGAARSSRRVSRAVFLAPHTGYWRDYAKTHRWLLFGVFHLLMPILAKCFGYFPARSLRLGNDLPKEFALQWASRRQPHLLGSDDAIRRFGPTVSTFQDIKAKVLALMMCDDPFAMVVGSERLCELYKGATFQLRVVTRCDSGLDRVGHFAFRSRKANGFFADAIVAWLLLKT